MKDIGLLFKTYQAYLPAISVMLAMSLGWALIVRFKPKWLGFDGKANWKAYLPCLLPIIVAFFATYQDAGTSIDYPQAIDMNNNLLFVSGVHEYQQEDSETGAKSTIRRDVVMVIDKQGKELTRFNAGSAKIQNNKIFLEGLENYMIADLTTGEIIDVLTENDIKERAAKTITEKIFEFKYNGGSSFDVRTVRDKAFTYDALLDAIDSNEGYTLFQGRNSSPPSYPGKTSLFQPVVIGETRGSTILLSYDDLEKNSFIVSAVDSNGNVLWSKHDNDISTNLAGAHFSHSKCKANTLIDDQNIYFVTPRYVVCLSLSSGDTKWTVNL